MGSVSWQFKKFADASSKPWFTQAWKNKIAAGFTNSATMNGDKHSTLHYMFTLSQQHGMVWVGTGLMPSNNKAAHATNPTTWGYRAPLAIAVGLGAHEMLPGDLNRQAVRRPRRRRSRPSAAGEAAAQRPSRAAIVRPWK